MRERLNVILERDIGFVLLIMTAGLLSRHESDAVVLRGFPAKWLMSGNHMSKIRPEYLILSLVLSICIVAAAELINVVVRRGEPVAFSKPKTTQFSMYEKAAVMKAAGAKNAADLLRKKSNSMSTGKRPVNNTKDFQKVILIIIVSMVFIVGSLLGISDNSNTDDSYDSSYDSYDDTYESLYDSNFYTEDGYLDDICRDAVARIADQDEEWLASFGEGDYQELISSADWAGAELEEDYRYVTASYVEEMGFINYRAETSDGGFMIGFKFMGDGMSDDESNAELVGIAVCPIDPWDENASEDDDALEEFTDSVNSQVVSIGDVEFFGVNILTW